MNDKLEWIRNIISFYINISLSNYFQIQKPYFVSNFAQQLLKSAKMSVSLQHIAMISSNESTDSLFQFPMTDCKLKSSRSQNKKIKSNLNYRIPAAKLPYRPRHAHQEADAWFARRKKELAERLPILNKDQIVERKYPYNVFLLNQMMTTGHLEVADEIVKLQKLEKLKGGSSNFSQNNERFLEISEALMKAESLKIEGDILGVVLVRKQLAEKLLKIRDKADPVLIKYFYQTCLAIMEEYHHRRIEEWDRFAAEIYTILAYLIKEEESSKKHLEESELQHAINLLKKSRGISKDKEWKFPQKLFQIWVKKPITFHGLRHELELIDSSFVSLYNIATLLEQDFLFTLASKAKNIEKATKYSKRALLLAHEVKYSVAVSSALLRHGLVLEKSNNCEEAMEHFQNLFTNCEINGDRISEAIALNRLGLCYIGRGEIINGLDCFAQQREISSKNHLFDLEADALRCIGSVLSSQGQNIEAEVCFLTSYDNFTDLKSLQLRNPYNSNQELNHHLDFDFGSKNFHELSWAESGLATGLCEEPRLVGSIRNRDLLSLIRWKTSREELPFVKLHPKLRDFQIIDVVLKSRGQSANKGRGDVQLIEDLYLPYYQEGLVSEADDKSYSQLYESLENVSQKRYGVGRYTRSSTRSIGRQSGSDYDSLKSQRSYPCHIEGKKSKSQTSSQILFMDKFQQQMMKEDQEILARMAKEKELEDSMLKNKSYNKSEAGSVQSQMSMSQKTVVLDSVNKSSRMNLSLRKAITDRGGILSVPASIKSSRNKYSVKSKAPSLGPGILGPDGQTYKEKIAPNY